MIATTSTPPAGGVPLLPAFLATRSSNVHGIALQDGALFVKFSSGAVYTYTGARAADHHAAMLKAESVGKYFATNVKKDAGLAVQRIEFCASCGAGVPPKPGEGVCPVCVPGAPEPPIAEAAAQCKCGARIIRGSGSCPACAHLEQHENGDGV